jgi:hypothetical protein
MQAQRPSFRGLSRGAFLVAALALAAGESARGKKLELEELANSTVELTAPLERSALVGGATAEIAWRPAAGADAFEGATEWEAFLSVDGGRTYPVRLTPHLDLGRRRFVFRVPDLPSEEVRLLLRIGDERVERAVRFPTRLRIVRPISPAPAEVEAAFAARPTAAPGEPALAGAAGVLFWVDGNRDGSNLRHRSAVPLGTHSAAASLLAGEAETLGSDDSDGLRPAPRSTPTTHPAAADRPPRALLRAEPPLPSDILLLIQRLNE